MKKKEKYFTRTQKRMVTALFALFLVAGTDMAEAAVDIAPATWSDFKAGVDAMHDGDTACFKAGKYQTDSLVVFIENGANINIKGADAGTVIDAGGKNYRGTFKFIYHDGGSVQNITVKNARDGGSGSAVMTYMKLRGGIKGCTFTNNRSGGSGGAVYVAYDLLGGITDSAFIGNSTREHGGAFYATGDLTGGITNCAFIGNESFFEGGAVFSGAIDRIQNSIFIGNKSGNEGGAVCIVDGTYTTILNNAGERTIFAGNTYDGKPNSIYFVLGVGTLLSVVGAGDLYMYDPMSTRDEGMLFIEKAGSGMWTLGGDNVPNGNAHWEISAGTLRLVEDSNYGRADARSASISGESFTLDKAAKLLAVPVAAGKTPASINTATTTLDGTVGVGSDERPRARIDKFNGVVLSVDNMTANKSTIAAKEGTFKLGQYDYKYKNLRWDGNKLVFDMEGGCSSVIHIDAVAIKKSSRHYGTLSRERNGVYSANAPLRATLANSSTTEVFGHIGDVLGSHTTDHTTNVKMLNLTEPKKQSGKEKGALWGTFLNNNTKTDPSGSSAGSSVNTPGLIIGADQQIGEHSFIGEAVSATWPDYEQGRVDADGKDIRLALYGGSELKDGWQIGYIVSAGRGDMHNSRLTDFDTSSAKYDTSSYTFGLSLAKPVEYRMGKTIKPYMSYEYIRSLSDGYTENSRTGLTDITSGGQNSNVSRVKLGLNHRSDTANGSYFASSLYWQGLFGDRKANVTSYMNAAAGSTVSLSGAGMDSSAIGLDLSWGRKVGKTDMALCYNGLFGAQSTSNTFSINFMYKF